MSDIDNQVDSEIERRFHNGLTTFWHTAFWIAAPLYVLWLAPHALEIINFAKHDILCGK